jgi:hypothetical protein
MVLVSVQDMCMVWAKHTIGSKVILDTPDGTTSFEAQLEARFSPFEDSANIKVCAWFAPNVPSARKSFWTH